MNASTRCLFAPFRLHDQKPLSPLHFSHRACARLFLDKISICMYTFLFTLKIEKQEHGHEREGAWNEKNNKNPSRNQNQIHVHKTKKCFSPMLLPTSLTSRRNVKNKDQPHGSRINWMFPPKTQTQNRPAGENHITHMTKKRKEVRDGVATTSPQSLNPSSCPWAKRSHRSCNSEKGHRKSETEYPHNLPGRPHTNHMFLLHQMERQCRSWQP